jgi:hypothetical protein
LGNYNSKKIKDRCKSRTRVHASGLLNEKDETIQKNNKYR